MSTITSAKTALPGTDTPERGPLLLWMIFTGLSIFAVVLLWRYGLIRLMVASDRTYISSIIAALYVITCGHCFWRTRAIAREGEAARRCRAILSAPDGARALESDARGAAGRAGDRSHPQSRHEGRGARRRSHRPDAAAARRWPTGCAVPTGSARSLPTR